MANVSVTYTINADEALDVGIEVDANYPDALAEATARARQLMRDTLADIIIVTNADTTEDRPS